jgi:hypothetical protein
MSKHKASGKCYTSMMADMLNYAADLHLFFALGKRLPHAVRA